MPGVREGLVGLGADPSIVGVQREDGRNAKGERDPTGSREFVFGAKKGVLRILAGRMAESSERMCKANPLSAFGGADKRSDPITPARPQLLTPLGLNSTRRSFFVYNFAVKPS